MKITLPGYSGLPKSCLIAFFVILLLPVSGFSQGTLNNCDPEYEKALTAYREGRINDVPNILKDCLGNWQGEREADAHKLLTNTYLYFNERAQAENAMLNFLKINPEYMIDADSTSENRDTPEFINLYNTFRTRPIFLIGAKAGGNLSFVRGIRSFSLEGEAFAGQKYTSRLGFQAGISVEVPLWQKFSLNPELYLAAKNYRYETTVMDFADVSFTEKQLWLELPVLLKYNFISTNRRKIPFINIGGSVQYLANSTAAVSRKDREANGNLRTLEDDKIEGIASLRNRINYNAIIGAGIKLKNIIGKGYIIIEGRYTHGLRNIVNPDKRSAPASGGDLLYYFLHVDNDFTINTFALSVGYIMPQYKPKVLRRSKLN